MIAIAGAAFAVNSVAQDGETTWFEGVLLLAVYALLGLAFFLPEGLNGYGAALTNFSAAEFMQ